MLSGGNVTVIVAKSQPETFEEGVGTRFVTLCKELMIF